MKIKIAKLYKNSFNSGKHPSFDDITEPKSKKKKGRLAIGVQSGHPRNECPLFPKEEIHDSHSYIFANCPECSGEFDIIEGKPIIIQQLIKLKKICEKIYEGVESVVPASDLKNYKNMKKITYALIIMAVSILLYLKIFSFELIYFDDHFLVNHFSQNKNDVNIVQVFRSMIYTSFYRPVLAMSFIMDAGIGGKNLNAFHATNLILHTLASMLVFFTLLKLGYSAISSFVFGLFVAVHPVLTPAVVWIPGRNDPMLTVFVLLSFISLIYLLESENGRFRKLCFLFHILFFEASLLSKESAIFFPVVCMSYVFLFRKENLISKTNKKLFIGWLAAGAIYGYLRIQATLNISNPDSVGLDAFFSNYLSIFALIGKIFMPVRMSGFPRFESFSIVSGICFIILIAGVFVLSKRIERKKALFGMIWFFLFLSPTLFVSVDNVQFDYLEHRVYTPMPGLIIFIMEVLKAHKVEFEKKPVFFFSIAVLSILLLRSYYYEDQFKNRKSFWTHTSLLFPQNSAAYINLGTVCFMEGDLDKSEEHFLKAIRFNPGFVTPYIDLSTVYKEKNDLEKAEQYAEKAISIDPKWPNAHHQLGKIYILQENWRKALRALQKAAELSKGGNPNLKSHIGFVLSKIKN